MERQKENVLPLSHEGQRSRFTTALQLAASARPNKQSFSTALDNIRRFFIATWLDWLLLVIVAAVMAGVWSAPHSFTRYFPVTSPNDTIYWPELAYPYLEPIFSPAAAGLLAGAIPVTVFAIAQIWEQSFADFSSAVLGLGYSMVTSCCFQVILKKTVGGLRPHFLAVCQPVFPPADGSTGTGYNSAMYTAAQICTGDQGKIKNALESFPSGHSNIAFSGFGYLSIYLFTHLLINSRTRRVSYWRLLLVVAPLLLATYLTSTVVLGYHHHATDAFAGAFIGWFFALFGYRMVYMGIWDARWNCVPHLRLRVDEDAERDRRESGETLQVSQSGEARMLDMA